MSDVINETPEVEVEETLDYKSLYEQQKLEFDKVLQNKNDLLAEKKKTQKERDEAKASALKAQEEQSKKDGEYEKLWQSESEQRKNLEQRLADITNNIKQEKLDYKALQLSNELANKAEHAELLSHFIKMKLSALADENGFVSDDVVQSIKKEFSNDKRYASLVAGSQANGGGATGSTNSVNKSGREMTRTEFNTLTHAQRSKFLSDKNNKLIQG